MLNCGLSNDYIEFGVEEPHEKVHVAEVFRVPVEVHQCHLRISVQLPECFGAWVVLGRVWGFRGQVDVRDAVELLGLLLWEKVWVSGLFVFDDDRPAYGLGMIVLVPTYSDLSLV